MEWSVRISDLWTCKELVQELTETYKSTCPQYKSIKVQYSRELRLTSVVCQVNEKTRDARGGKTIECWNGIRLELHKVAFERAHKHLRARTTFNRTKSDEEYINIYHSCLIIRQNIWFDNSCRSVNLRESRLELLRQADRVARRNVFKYTPRERSSVTASSIAEDAASLFINTIRGIVCGAVVLPAIRPAVNIMVQKNKIKSVTNNEALSVNGVPTKSARYGTVTVSGLVPLTTIRLKVKLSCVGIGGPARSPTRWEKSVSTIR